MLPDRFLERMKNILGEDYCAFITSLEEERVRALRVNRLKLTEGVPALPITRLPYTEDGYVLESDEPVGTTPEHHAGIIYMQDPAAMAPVSAIDIPRGARVLDLCAAPGGKSGQLAAKIGNSGFLLSNEYVPKRAKILVGNLERLGVKNALVTSLDTHALTRLFDSYFDVVVADAPCSGEGMFRKSEEALTEWSEEAVYECAERQRDIIENAYRLTREGGYIIYSTCTYEKEENEDVVAYALGRHSDLSLVEVGESLRAVTRDGIDMPSARRFYPHVSRGEGQFLAVLKKENGGSMPTILYKDAAKPLTREEEAAVKSFFSDNLISTPDARLCKVRDNIVLMPHGVPVMPNSVFMSGVLVGEVRGKLLFPSHNLFSSYGELLSRKLELSGDSDRLTRYLRGEEIENVEKIPSGYLAITYMGAPLGGAKAVGDRIKNHYPKGLRNK